MAFGNFNPFKMQKRQGPSLSDALQHKFTPGMSKITDATGTRLTNDEAARRGPFTAHGWSGSGVRRGPRIGSAAGALNSPGTPTSQRGRFDQAMEHGASESEAMQSASMPTQFTAELARKQWGLAPSWSRGLMGALPPQPPIVPQGTMGTQPVTNMPEPVQTTSQFTKTLLPNYTKAMGRFGSALGAPTNFVTAPTPQKNFVAKSSTTPSASTMNTRGAKKASMFENPLSNLWRRA